MSTLHTLGAYLFYFKIGAQKREADKKVFVKTMHFSVRSEF